MLDILTGILTGNILVAMVALVAIAILGTIVTYAKNRHNVAPNQVAVISGRKKDTKGYRIVTGGGFFLWPILERIDYLYLNVMNFSVQVMDVPDKNGVLVDVTGVANVKIKSDAENLPLAIERFLGKRVEEIQAVAKENLEANLRAIIGTMTVEELNSDRNKLQGQVITEAGTDLGKLGLGVDVLNIQQVTDKQGYIKSLGKARTAQVVRDADIGEANARRDAAIAKATTDQEAQIQQAASAEAVSEAMRKKDLVVAENAAKVEAARARVPIIAKTAAADESARLAVAEVNSERARVEEETKLQAHVATRNRAEQEATTLVTARANADAAVLTAEGQRTASVVTAEGQKSARTLEGEANRVRDEQTALGRQALAKATQVEGEADAAATKARLIADADGTRARGLAEADTTRARGLAEADAIGARGNAEAEAIKRKAEAFQNMPQNGITLMLLEASPLAIRAFGDAVGAAMKPAADAIGAGLGNIDEVRVIDFGHANSNGSGNVFQQFANLPVETMMAMIEKAKAAGAGPMLEQLARRFLSPPSTEASE